MFFFFKQKTAYDMRISDWSSDVCSSDLHHIRSIAESIHIDFNGVTQIAVDQNGAIPRHLHGRGDIVIELAFAVDDFHRPAAKHIGWANEHGITDAIGYRYGFLPAASDTIFRLLELQLVDQCGKPLAILDRKSTRLNSSHKCAYR